jgi:hypothetical protein
MANSRLWRLTGSPTQGKFNFPCPILSAALIVPIVPVPILIAIFQEFVVGGLTRVSSVLTCKNLTVKRCSDGDPQNLTLH